MEDKEIILSGPTYSGEEFWGSFAEFVIPRMKALPRNQIIQVDAKTNERVTVREFLKMSIGIAEGLIDLGLKLGDVVVHGCHNHTRSFLAAFGVMLSGGVFTPVDTTGKPVELQSLFAQFQPKFIICEADKAEGFQNAAKAVSLDPQVILISDSGSGDFLTWNDMLMNVDVDNYTPRKVSDPKNDLLTMSCTSGSTGLPKAVALSHHTIITNQLVLESLNIEGSHSNILITSPLFWISGTLFLVDSCSTGQPHYIAKSSLAEDILKAIQDFKPSYILLSPMIVRKLVESPSFKNYDLSSIKLIVTSGAVLGPSIAEKIKTIWKGVPLVQIYGLTEVCGGITTVASFVDSMTVGKLMPGSQMKVVDITTGKSVGPNRLGECRLKTITTMRGYYNREEETKETFDENGWFKTGDLVYYNEDGFIYLVDRIKESIKYTSFQMSPAEIESFIIGLPGVKDVAVVPVPHEIDGNHIRALVVKDIKSDITADFIIQSVKDNFTDPKHLRGGVQFVQALPRTEIGKLKRVEAKKMIIL